MEINTIYTAVQGEVNVNGIGSPVIFVRTSFCHLRCFVKTIGVLCDTPEALERGSGKEMSTAEIIDKVNEISLNTGGIKLVCLSGGDPLAQNTEELLELFEALGKHDYTVSVETSGTLSIADYREFSHVHWVIDYKTKSAGLKAKFFDRDLPILTENDFIKFVIYDEEDYQQFFVLFEVIRNLSDATIAVGCYWNGLINNAQLFEKLVTDQLLGKVVMNVQLHKLTTLYDNLDKEIIANILIPKEI